MKLGLFVLCSAFLPVAAFACSSTTDAPAGDAAGGSSDSAYTGGTSGGSAVGGTAGTGSTGTTVKPNGGGTLKNEETGGTPDPGDTAVSETDSCTGLALKPDSVEVEHEVTTTTETQVPAPVALYIMLDNTLSMDETGTGSTASKWEQAVSALTDFVEDSASAGIDVAIQYFNPVGAGQDADKCDGVAHANPAVPMGTLPDQADAIVSSLESTKTSQTTPTVGALIGATNYCATFQTDHPDEKCVAIVVTDGQPNACGLSNRCSTTTDTDAGTFGRTNECVDPNSASVLTLLAVAGLANGVVTFTVGMSGVTEEGFTLLNQIAVAGGSDCTPDAAGAEACDVSTTGAAGLLAALNAIRDSVTVVETHTETVTSTEVVALPCEWELPEPPKGETLDPLLVNVNIVDAATTPALYVSSATDCQLASGPAWYYDDPAAPTKIFACPVTCDLLSSLPTAGVQVLLGCRRKEIML